MGFLNNLKWSSTVKKWSSTVKSEVQHPKSEVQHLFKFNRGLRVLLTPTPGKSPSWSASPCWPARAASTPSSTSTTTRGASGGGTGQCTHCRGGAESVLTLSSTVIGVGLHRLGANLTRRKGKYTSASPRCTCLPSRKICIGVALGDPPQTPLQCWLVGRTSTPRLRLGVLASQLVNIALKLHSEENKYIKAKSSLRVNIAEESVVDHRVQLQCKFDEKEGKYTEAKPRCTCPSYESNLHQVGEVQHQLPLNLMLVHFRPHLCHGYTDQYHSCNRSRVQLSNYYYIIYKINLIVLIQQKCAVLDVQSVASHMNHHWL